MASVCFWKAEVVISSMPWHRLGQSKNVYLENSFLAYGYIFQIYKLSSYFRTSRSSGQGQGLRSTKNEDIWAWLNTHNDTSGLVLVRLKSILISVLFPLKYTELVNMC